MNLIIIPVFILVVSGIIVKMSGNRDSTVISIFNIASPLISCGLILIPIFNVICFNTVLSFSVPWSFFHGSIHFELDALSGFFLLPIILLTSVITIYSHAYIRKNREKYNTGTMGFAFNILIASMIVVLIAKNAIIFLIAWELMSLSSFFLVISEKHKKETKKAGLIYLAVTHIGTAFLIIFFIILGKSTGLTAFLDFSSFVSNGTGNRMLPEITGICFILALLGFGSKAGIVPLHIWLPEAHPAAPSHISALMSGVMIKTGIYGIMRTLTFLGTPPVWWGVLLICLGIVSALTGILYALLQHDIKRLLAYSSVENIGIILIGMGLGIYGLSINSIFIAVAGFSGCLLHVLNHSIFKGLLFLGAGSIINQTKTRNIERMGGLIKHMPITTYTFLIGSIAISGIPPLNGFISEFLIFSGAFKGLLFSEIIKIIPFLLIIISLALVGGLTLTCFTKVFGITFIGNPRQEYDRDIKENPGSMTLPLFILSVMCLLIGLFSFYIIPLTRNALLMVPGINGEDVNNSLAEISIPLINITIISCILFVLILFFSLIKKILLSKRKSDTTVTWDCGYIHPSAKMQYTASSFVKNIFSIFKQKKGNALKEIPGDQVTHYFPEQNNILIPVHASFIKKSLTAINLFLKNIFSGILQFQHGNMHVYILYILITLIFLLFWGMN